MCVGQMIPKGISILTFLDESTFCLYPSAQLLVGHLALLFLCRSGPSLLWQGQEKA